MSLSALKRLSWLVQSEQRMADLVVIGSGLTGASIALDAASRGIHTLVIDEKDVQAYRNGRSTTFLTHSLSLAMNGNWKLLRHIRREQQLIAKVAPNLLEPVSVYVPFRQKDSTSHHPDNVRSRFYSWLTNIGNGERPARLNYTLAKDTEPLLGLNQLQGAGIFNTYDIDECRLTMELLKTAVQYGAFVMNYCKIEHYLYEGEQISGVVIRDLLGNRSFRIRARSVINAAGIQTQSFMYMDNKQSTGTLPLKQCTQIIVPHNRLPLKQAFYEQYEEHLHGLERMTILPRGDLTYISDYSQSTSHIPDSVTMTSIERDQLLQKVNRLFPAARLKPEDVRSGGIGLRLPTVYAEKTPSLSTMNTPFHQSPSGLISIMGEPLWGYRILAEQIVNLAAEQIFKQIGKNFSDSRTDTLPLCGTPRPSLLQAVNEQQEEVKQQQEDELAAEWSSRYGVHAKRLLAQLRKADWEQHLSKQFKVLTLKQYVELYYAVHEEMVSTPCDYIERKLQSLPESIDNIEQWTADITEAMSQWIGWSLPRKAGLKEQARSTAERIILCNSLEDSIP